MSRDELHQGLLQSSGVSDVATGVGGLDVLDDHAPDQHLPVRLVNQVAAELDRHGLRQMLMLGDGVDLLLRQLTESQAVLERQHHRALTELAESERRMLHSQKMAAVGQLARKVSHSFANALHGILGRVELASASADDPAEVRELMAAAAESIDHAGELSAQLLAFSTPAPLKAQRMDLAHCIRSMERILKEATGPEIALELRDGAGVAKVNIDPDRIEQAVIHMAVNAAEAMQGQGTLTISVERADLSSEERRRLQAGLATAKRYDGPYALLSVKDSGPGLPDDMAHHVFEPFFTTKTGEENAGLGLTSVYNIIRQHDGFIEVQSPPNNGTTFLVYLPTE